MDMAECMKLAKENPGISYGQRRLQVIYLKAERHMPDRWKFYNPNQTALTIPDNKCEYSYRGNTKELREE